VAIGAGAQTIELKFSGTAESAADGKLSGTLKSAFGAATKWTAGRKAPGEPGPKNPVALSIESGAESEVKAAEGQTPAPVTCPSSSKPTACSTHRDRRQPVPQRGHGLHRARGAASRDQHLVKNGKIAAFGRDLAPEPGMTVIDVAGRFVRTASLTRNFGTIETVAVDAPFDAVGEHDSACR